jgi:hypothetical protein
VIRDSEFSDGNFGAGALAGLNDIRMWQISKGFENSQFIYRNENTVVARMGILPKNTVSSISNEAI